LGGVAGGKFFDKAGDFLVLLVGKVAVFELLVDGAHLLVPRDVVLAKAHIRQAILLAF
jgi:hypothetical protein